MNRLYGLIAAVCACLILFIVLALSGGKVAEPAKAEGGPVAPTAKKELQLALDSEPQTLDPISVVDTISDGVGNKIYNKLVRLQFNEKRELIAVPDLAESFTITPDGKLYTFKLRKGVHFHNGREVKAADAVYSLKRLMNGLSKRADLMQPFVKGSEKYCKDNESMTDKVTHDDPELGIKALDDYTLQIELSEPFAPFIQHLCTISCAVVPQEAAEDKTHIFSRTPVGTGPFKMKPTDWVSNQYLLLERNDDYFAGKPKLDSVRFSIYKDRSLQLKRFMDHKLHACQIPAGRVKTAIQEAGEENVLTSATMRTNYIGISSPNGDFKNKADLTPFGTNKYLRQAMNYALDRDYIAEKLMEGRAIPAHGILPPGMPGFKPDRPGWPKDLVKAKALMVKAGYPDGKGLPPISLMLRNDEDTRHLALAIAWDLEQIGITVELQAMEWNAFLQAVENEPKAMFLLGWVADYPDPDNFLYVLFNSKQFGSAGNQTWYSNPEVDELTQKARNLIDINERAKIYYKVEDILLDESPWICTIHAVNTVLLRKEVKGIRGKVTPLDTGTEFPQVDFKDVDIVE